MTEALRSGLVAELIAERARERAAQFIKRKRVIVGVSEFADVAEVPVVRPKPASAPAWATTGADDSTLQRFAGALTLAPNAGWLEAAVGALTASASLEQVTRVLGGAADPTTVPPLPQLRDAEPFEALRARADELAAQGSRPSVFLCNLGPIPEHKARSQFAAGFFAAGGFTTLDNDGFSDATAAAEAFAASGARIAVLCGSDEGYASLVEHVAPRLRDKGAARIVLAGRPGDAELSYRAAGVTSFVFMGSELPPILSELLEVAT
jgi:methylmalonyl-CoA mutase